MSQWIRTLHIKEEWKQAKEGKITIQKLAEVIYKRLSLFKHMEEDYEFQNILEQFDDLSKQKECNADDDFDPIMEELYDWADECIGESENTVWGKKNCWIETF